MKIHSRRLVILFALAISVAASRTASAQTPVIGVESQTWALLPPATLASHADPVGPPANLIATPKVRELADAMWRGSSTFRRQSARIAAAASLQITIVQGMPHKDGMARAETTCRRVGGTLVSASVWIPFGVDETELLAHELEHIIEQLDDIDLPAFERQAGSGVRAAATGHFETVRAIAIGRLVAKEMANRPVVKAER